MTIPDIFSAIDNGDLGSFYSLISGVKLVPIHAEMCVEKCLLSTGRNTDIMARCFFKAFNLQLASMASMFEKWTRDDVAALDTEVYVSKLRMVST